MINSGVRHAHASGEYAVRRRESFEAAAMLRVAYLRDVTLEQLSRATNLPETLARRARHIVTENQRVLDARERTRCRRSCSRRNTLLCVARIDARRLRSLDTGVDALVEWAKADADVYGARLTGGGFGGRS